MTLEEAQKIVAESQENGNFVAYLDSKYHCTIDGEFTTEDIEAILIVRKAMTGAA